MLQRADFPESGVGTTPRARRAPGTKVTRAAPAAAVTGTGTNGSSSGQADPGQDDHEMTEPTLAGLVGDLLGHDVREVVVEQGGWRLLVH